MPTSKLDCVMTSPETGMVIAVATYRVDAERLFEALTDTVEIGRWWGGRRGGSSVTWLGYAETGAPWRAEGEFSGDRIFQASGMFLLVERPHRIVQSWRASWAGADMTEASLRFELGPDGTVLSLVHTGFHGHPEACEAQAQIWWKVIKWLHLHLEGGRRTVAAA